MYYFQPGRLWWTNHQMPAGCTMRVSVYGPLEQIERTTTPYPWHNNTSKGQPNRPASKGSLGKSLSWVRVSLAEGRNGKCTNKSPRLNSTPRPSISCSQVARGSLDWLTNMETSRPWWPCNSWANWFTINLVANIPFNQLMSERRKWRKLRKPRQSLC